MLPLLVEGSEASADSGMEWEVELKPEWNRKGWASWQVECSGYSRQVCQARP
jgi:hypothetical protein